MHNIVSKFPLVKNLGQVQMALHFIYIQNLGRISKFHKHQTNQINVKNTLKIINLKSQLLN